jgi:flagellar basal-body rod protein FlgC
MAEFSDALSIASSGLKAQAARIRFVSENIANADTPGFRRKTTTFEEASAFSAPEGTVEIGRVRLDQSPLPEIYEPSHPMARENGTYEGSNVDLIIEIADAREAQRSYEANLKVFDQTRQMSSSLMDLLRR